MYLQLSILAEESQSLPMRSKANERFLGHSIRYLDLFLEILCHMVKECENIEPMLPLKGIQWYMPYPTSMRLRTILKKLEVCLPAFMLRHVDKSNANSIYLVWCHSILWRHNEYWQWQQSFHLLCPYKMYLCTPFFDICTLIRNMKQCIIIWYSQEIDSNQQLSPVCNFD